MSAPMFVGDRNPLPPLCLNCKEPCPDDPTKAWRINWMGALIGFLCGEKCGREYKGKGGVTNSDGSLDDDCKAMEASRG